jgi:hypothetical protein
MLMQSTRNKACLIFFALACGGGAPAAPAGDGCLDFKWDVTRERALFAGTPVALTVGKDAMSAPLLVPNRLYGLRLMAQDQVAFSVTPARRMQATRAFAGLTMLKVEVPGSYRIAVDLPSWIDVVSDGTLLQPTDFQGQHACGAPHKIVEFNLVGKQPFVLQFSDAVTDKVLLTVTPTPLRKF